MALRVDVKAACCARRGVSAERFDEWVARVCWVKVWDRAASKASFCGFGGIGGGAMVDGWVGSVASNGDVRRSSGGFCFDGGDPC